MGLSGRTDATHSGGCPWKCSVGCWSACAVGQWLSVAPTLVELFLFGLLTEQLVPVNSGVAGVLGV